MRALLKFSNAVDWLNTQVGKWVIWLILGSTVISGVNAVVRKAFNISSNAYLEVQWYLFAASFLLAAGYTLLQGWSYKNMWWITHNAHGAYMARGIHGQTIVIDGGGVVGRG